MGLYTDYTNTSLKFRDVQKEPDELEKSFVKINTVKFAGKDVDIPQLSINLASLVLTLGVFLWYFSNSSNSCNILFIITLSMFVMGFFITQILFTPPKINDVNLEIELLLNVNHQTIMLLGSVIIILMASKIAGVIPNSTNTTLLIGTITILALNIIQTEHTHSSLIYRNERIIRENIINISIFFLILYLGHIRLY
jgi:hypothetical protein